jgi:hypothetical protein
MNRRDLLKQGGAALLAASSVRATALADRTVSKSNDLQDLVISFSGPFCYWPESDAEGDYIRIMAPQVVKPFCAPHLPWVGTTANEARFKWCPTKTYEYDLTGLKSRTVTYSGTTMCSFNQETCRDPLPAPPPGCRKCPTEFSTSHSSSSVLPPHGTNSPQEVYDCCPALFWIRVPIPDRFIGINPTCVEFTPNRPDGPKYASGVNFFYENRPDAPIDLENIRIVCPQPPGGFDFHADFQNDHGLPSATLRINLSPLNSHDDPNHTHAKQVFFQMLKMFPWVDVKSIKFCDRPVQNGNACSGAQVGPGDDCLAPVFLLMPQTAGKRTPKK